MRGSWILAGVTLVTGCTDGGDDTGCEPVNDMVLADVNNYQFEGTLDIRSADVEAAGAEGFDLHVDWSAVTTDLQGHPVSPTEDVDTVTIVAFPDLTEAEVEDKLSTNTLIQADIGAYAFQTVDGTGLTETNLSNLTLLGNDIDIETYLTEGSATWMMMIATGDTPGVGTLLIHFLHPLSSSSNREVVFDDAATVLDFTVNLGELTPLTVDAGEPLTVDWSGLTQDGRGAEFELSDIDRIKVAYFADRSFEELADIFLDVELEADKLWSVDVQSGSSFDLSQLTGPEEFTGITDEGTWALALQCSTCSNPAPLFFSQMTTCGTAK